MDFVNKFTGGGNEADKKNTGASSSSEQKQRGGGLMDKMNNFAGGGQKGEKNEDALDKGVDMFQEKVLGQGPQNNESAAEQAKDEAVSDFIRDKYKGTTGSEFPISDKDKKFGS